MGRLEKICCILGASVLFIGLILVYPESNQSCQSTDKVVVSIGMCDSEYCRVLFNDGTIKVIHHPVIGETVSVCP